MTRLVTPRLILRNWRDGDRPLFHEINSDAAVMEFFPFRRDRAQSDELMDRLAIAIARDGMGFCAVEIAETGETAGFAGLAFTDLEPLLPDGTVEIGWRLARRHWGKGIASEAARAWLRHGFEQMGLAEIVSFAVEQNLRSIRVMERIGMRRDRARDFDHPRVPPEHPGLKRHALYAMTREEWRATQ